MTVNLGDLQKHLADCILGLFNFVTDLTNKSMGCVYRFGKSVGYYCYNVRLRNFINCQHFAAL